MSKEIGIRLGVVKLARGKRGWLAPEPEYILGEKQVTLAAAPLKVLPILIVGIQ